MKRLYKIEIPGGHAETDALIQRTHDIGAGPVGGSGVLGDRAFIQVWRNSDEEALAAARSIVGPEGWTVSVGYGINRRAVNP